MIIPYYSVSIAIRTFVLEVSYLPDNFRNDFKQIPDYGYIRNLHHGCIGVFVYSYDQITGLHSYKMLNLSGNTAGYINLCLDCLSCLSDLVCIRDPARINSCPACTYSCSAYPFGKLF